MFPRIFDIALDILRFGSVSIFLGVVSSFLFLLLVSRDRRGSVEGRRNLWLFLRRQGRPWL